MAEFSIYHFLFILFFNLSIIYYFFVWSWVSFCKINAPRMVAICVSTNCTRTTTVGYISVCLFLSACGESSNVSGTEIHPVTPHVFLASPSGVNALPRHIYQRTDKCPDVLSAISAPHPLSVSQLEPPPPPPSLILSFSPSVQLPSRLYQWRFWFHYCWGQNFLCSQGEWHTIRTHSASGVDTEMHRNKGQGASDEHNKVWTELRW